jgi:chaperonin GroES
MKFKPLHDRIIVKTEKAKDVTDGGIVLLDSSLPNPIRGVIVDAGSGLCEKSGKIIPLTVKAGDRVIFSDQVGSTVTINGEQFLVMKECDLVGVLNDLSDR